MKDTARAYPVRQVCGATLKSQARVKLAMGMIVAPAGAADAIPALAANAADATTAAVTSMFALRRAINVNPSVFKLVGVFYLP
jgi:hypothetical protein